MRVVLATGGMAPEPGGVPLTTASGAVAPRAVASALASGWCAARPADELVIAPLSEGGAGVIDTLPAAAVAARYELAGTGPLGQSRMAPLVELAGRSAMVPGQGDPAVSVTPGGRTWLLDADALVALPADPAEAATEAAEGTTIGLGQVLQAALALTSEGDTLVVGLGRSAVHDGGAGMLRALGGSTLALDYLRGRELVLALADTASLSGLGGAGQGLIQTTALSASQAQEVDRRACSAVASAFAAIEQARRDHGGTGPSRPAVTVVSTAGGVGQRRLSVTAWGSGAGGGSAAILCALGARALPGGRVMADLTGLAELVGRTGGTDLIVTTAGEVYDVLADSVPAIVGELATSQALPAILVCRQSLVPRGELAQAGLSAVYSLADSPFMRTHDSAGRRDWGDGIVPGLEDLGARLARTWSR